MSDSLANLMVRIQRFAAARDWEQFNSPKNLSMALAIEAAELMEHFQWLTPEQSSSLNAAQREEVALELADVLIYALRLAQQLRINPLAAARRKMRLNALKYPVAKARGRADKADKL